MQELQARLRETEGIVEAGLDIDEAELLVARYVDAVAAAAGAAQARSGGAGDTADEEIEEVVKVGYIYIFFSCTGSCLSYGIYKNYKPCCVCCSGGPLVDLFGVIARSVHPPIDLLKLWIRDGRSMSQSVCQWSVCWLYPVFCWLVGPSIRPASRLVNQSVAHSLARSVRQSYDLGGQPA